MIGRILTLVRFEMTKLWGRRVLLVPTGFYARRGPPAQSLLAPPLLLVVFFVLALTSIGSGYGTWVIDKAQELSGSENANRAFRNAWSVTASSMITAQHLGLIFLLVLSGTSMAEESQYGTLKAVLTRPFRRVELVTAKLLSLLLFTILLVAVLAAAGVTTGALLYDFEPVRDPQFQDYIQVTYGQMAKATLLTFLLMIPPLVATMAFAVMVSTLVEQPGYAVGVAVGGVLLLEVLGSVSRDLAPYIFVCHLDTLVDTAVPSPLKSLEGKALQFATAGIKPHEAAFAATVSVVSGLAWSGITMWRLSVRDIGD